MKPQASEHMNSTSSPISSGSPKRFIGTSSRNRCSSSGEVCAAAWKGVRIGPGEMERQRIPRSAPVRHARHVDDHAMAVTQHVRQDRLHAVQYSLDVERKGVLEEGIIDVEEFAAPQGGAGRVEEEMYSPEMLDRL